MGLHHWGNFPRPRAPEVEELREHETGVCRQVQSPGSAHPGEGTHPKLTGSSLITATFSKAFLDPTCEEP